MTRKEFLKISALLGVAVPLPLNLSSCGSETVTPTTFNGKVIIVGAGPGGLSAGYLLAQQGIDFEILEASDSYGGRTRIETDFADFPIALGSEWIETDLDVFDRIVNDTAININIATVPDDQDHKFVDLSWYGFFEQYIAPSVLDKIRYGTVVQSIDYTGDKVVINTSSASYEANKVVVSVPLKVLQEGDISFTPALPTSKTEAINSTVIWDGFKAFIEFSDNFYGDGKEFTITPDTDGQKIYYDATKGRNSSKNILGLFVVGKPAEDYISRSDNDLRDFILSELDGLFENQATPNYIKHITQNWNDEPFIKGGYMSDHAHWRTVKALGISVADKVYFAGGAYTDGEDWVSVHTAAQSAQVAVAEILV